jgi:hypothetical protein
MEKRSMADEIRPAVSPTIINTPQELGRLVEFFQLLIDIDRRIKSNETSNLRSPDITH